ncbi:HpcH/HpaI aldolase/citrate lyase family protein [Terricaulis silvestris]|uniref:Citrate lyase subunit beta-like protein n=1 Tax=Terricaulis silvestris TaxID=2686094 RepID=A0A6I6MGA2_9CAUL|nr:CoA ester lyase [Terricaulis silvestris]QGZ93665.1 Citrate lyase subunit beta-like protein [Terricaulis silvestris]
MLRSFLFVPAIDEKRLARVHERGADAVILDLEDAVPPEAKAAARAGLRGVAEGLAAKGVKVFVRVNADTPADIDAAVCGAVQGIVAPKVRGASQAADIVEAIGARANARPVDFIALIESASGIFNAAPIAGVNGVSGLALGSEDLTAELGVAPTADSLDLPCKMIALAAATRGLMALGAPVSIGEFRDLDLYRNAIALARRVGMTGTFCIHPAQVAVANDGFAPSPAELDEARALLAAWREAEATGVGVIAHGGRMIDAPVVARAKRLLGIST